MLSFDRPARPRAIDTSGDADIVRQKRRPERPADRRRSLRWRDMLLLVRAKTAASSARRPVPSSTLPAAGGTTPASVRSSVVFPAPLGPRTAVNSPRAISNEVSESSVRVPARSSKLRAAIIPMERVPRAGRGTRMQARRRTPAVRRWESPSERRLSGRAHPRVLSGQRRAAPRPE